jgi:hypothetical protein
MSAYTFHVQLPPAVRRPSLDGWLAGYLALGRALAEGRIHQEAWREGMDCHFSALDLEALKARLGFPARLAEFPAVDFRGRGEVFQTLAEDGGPPGPDPEPSRRVITKLAWVKRGGSIPPHAHLNMVSAFLVLSGRFRVRQYEKVSEDPGHMRIRPRLDEVQGPGAWSTTTDAARNVHWLTALEEGSSLFTTKIIRLREGAPYAGRIHLDLRAAEAEGDGLLRAPKVAPGEARILSLP